MVKSMPFVRSASNFEAVSCTGPMNEPVDELLYGPLISRFVAVAVTGDELPSTSVGVVDQDRGPVAAVLDVCWIENTCSAVPIKFTLRGLTRNGETYSRLPAIWNPLRRVDADAGFVAVAMYRYVSYAVVTPVTLSTVVKKSDA